MRLEGPGRGFRDQTEGEALPAVLQKLSFHTAQISPFGQRHAARQFYAGFHEIHNTGQGGGESAEVVMPVVEDWLRRKAASDDWFLHINFWDPHTPYRVPLPYGDPFSSDPLPAWFTEETLARHQRHPGPHGALQICMYDDGPLPEYPRQPTALRSMADLRRMIDGYDTAIRYSDDQVARILDLLQTAGIEEETAVMISADHGENQGELGLYGEHGTADAITCRVPLIIRWPGLPGGSRVERGLQYQIDLAPTLIELLGKSDRRPTSWDGTSFARAVRGEPHQGREFLVLSQCAHVCQRSVRFGPWIYIRTYHDGFHLFPKEMLYHLEEDPHEQRNLAESRPDVCREAAYRLLGWHDDMMASSPSDIDPLWTVMREGGPYHARGNLKKYCHFLEKTGRGFAIPELRQRHPREF
jgi:arylsulfatase A-like enzyme